MSANKWCPLRLYGQPVDTKLAREIIFRTQRQAIPYTNDHAWTKAIYREIGYEQVNKIGNTLEELAVDRALRSLTKILPLNVLFNDQVSSCYIGGPHGWINWDGAEGLKVSSQSKQPFINTITTNQRLGLGVWLEIAL
jgi:hypothetical protein